MTPPTSAIAVGVIGLPLLGLVMLSVAMLWAADTRRALFHAVIVWLLWGGVLGFLGGSGQNALVAAWIGALAMTPWFCLLVLVFFAWRAWRQRRAAAAAGEPGKIRPPTEEAP